MKGSPPTSTMNNILGLGTDILEISRFKETLDKHGQKFLDKVFSPKEQEYCRRYQDPTSRFAVRFAAKEAVAKALGTGFGKHLSFQDIEILNDPSGKPSVLLSPAAAAHFDNPTFHLSLSHSHHYATATALALH